MEGVQHETYKKSPLIRAMEKIGDGWQIIYMSFIDAGYSNNDSVNKTNKYIIQTIKKF